MEVAESPGQIDIEPAAESSGETSATNGGKQLSKSARNRRNKRLRNQQKQNDTPAQNDASNQEDNGDRKLTQEEKNQRRKLYMERNEEKNILQALRKLRGPTIGLPTEELQTTKFFSSECRLYVGGIPTGTTLKNIEDLFTPFGEVSDVYVSAAGEKNSFALLRMDTLEHMELARRNLNRSFYKNRRLFVHASRKPCSLRIKNLSGSVTNELLKQAFEIFGEVERAIVQMSANDESNGEGIIQFSNHSSAQTALRYCTEESFFLTASCQPVICELFNGVEEKIGFSEVDIDHNTPFYLQERSVGPRFAENPSQYEYGKQYKQLFAAFEFKQNQLQEEFKRALYNLHREIKLIQCNNELELLRRQIQTNDGIFLPNVTGASNLLANGSVLNQQRKKWNKKSKDKSRPNQNPSTSQVSMFANMYGGVSGKISQNTTATNHNDNAPF